MNNTVGLMMVVRNEVKEIKECLDWHLKYVDEVAICDQSSDDGTYEILLGYKNRSKKPFKLIRDINHGYCEPSKQKTADLLTTEWILYIDADERFNLEFLETIKKYTSREDVDGFQFPRKNLFKVKVFDESVPIEPKELIVTHPAKDYQLRLTRKSVSKFPVYLHNRVRINLKDGTRRDEIIRLEIEHLKNLDEQRMDAERYRKVKNG